MGESMQAVAALGMIIGIIGSFLSFMSVGPQPNWAVFFSMLALAIGSFALLLWSLLRRDKVPDLLKEVPGPLLERDGFCFKILTTVEKGRCHLDLHFQTRYSNQSRASVVIQPSKGFFLLRPGLANMHVVIECPAGGSGTTRLPWPVVQKFQGKKQTLDVAADVQYPEGRGKMIRYRGGKQVGSTGRQIFAAVLTVAGALGGMIVLSKPCRIKLKFPKGVEESVADDLPISTRILWNLETTTPSTGKPKGPMLDL